MAKPKIVLNLSNPTYETIERDDLMGTYEEMIAKGFTFISAQHVGGRMQITVRQDSEGNYVTIRQAK